MNHSHMATKLSKRKRDRVKVTCLQGGKKIKYWSVQAEVIRAMAKEMGCMVLLLEKYILNVEEISHSLVGFLLKNISKTSGWYPVFTYLKHSNFLTLYEIISFVWFLERFIRFAWILVKPITITMRLIIAHVKSWTA